MNKFIQLGGELFEQVQLGGVFPDSKTFVDSCPASDPEIILKKFNDEKASPLFDLKKFVRENFDLTSRATKSLKFDDHRSMEDHISLLWETLTRQPDDNISPFSTLLPLPYSYVVPGGRFTEIYYWDSYFTAEGLAASGRLNIVESMVKNFAFLVEKYGHIPNGNRVYFLSRSQPPFFCSMIDIIFKHKGINAVLPYLPALEKEYCFWMKNERAISIGGFVLNRYWDDTFGPREESYKEDLDVCRKADPVDKENFYRNIRAACESGWDFCSRWFKDEKTFSTIRTTELLPVDLNCLMYNIEFKLSDWFSACGLKNKSQEYRGKADARKKAIHQFFWNDGKRFFFDYCFTEQKQTNTWSLAGLFPLFFGLATAEQAESVVNHISREFLCDGGLVTTLTQTGQQWDSPNGWAPLQWIAVISLKNYGYDTIAEEISKRFVIAAANVFKRTGKMMEKYNVCDLSLEGGGGEYAIQDGFGWTNGVICAFMKEFPVTTREITRNLSSCRTLK